MVALASLPAHAQDANSEVRNLKQTVEELRKQLQELKSLVQKQASASPEATDGESQEALDARTAATKADIQGLRTDLENYKYDNARQLERNVPSVARNTRIGGSLTLRYEGKNPETLPTNANSGPGVATPTSNGFSNIGFGLNFSGNLYRDYAEGRNLTYRLAFTNLATASASTNSVNLTDGYVRYSFQPASGNPEDPLGTITVGQQAIPFGLDAQALDPEVKAVIGNAGFVSGLGLGTRQIGLAIAGDYDPYVDFTNNYRAPLLTYALGIYNGNGNNKADNNDHRDIVGRLVYTLPVDYNSWFRQLQIGASFYKGRASLAATPSTGTANPVAATKLGKQDRYGFDVNWTHLPYSIAYEWAYGKTDLFAATATNPDGVQRGKGQYVNFGYTWGEQFLASSRNQGKFDDYWPKSYQAFLRYDSWDPNTSTLGAAKEDRVLATTVGLNVFFAETTRLQINHVTTRNQKPYTLTKPKTPSIWQIQLSSTF